MLVMAEAPNKYCNAVTEHLVIAPWVSFSVTLAVLGLLARE
jgi:hypothetical protein